VTFQKTSKLSIIILILSAVALTAATYAAITVNQNIPSTGSIYLSLPSPTPSPTSTPITGSPGVGVFSDQACTTSLTSLNWGQIAPGGTTTLTVYVKNTGTAAMTLSLTVSNWSPSNAPNYISLSWNQVGTVVQPGQSVAATLTLTVQANVSGITTFSNTIIISGTG